MMNNDERRRVFVGAGLLGAAIVKVFDDMDDARKEDGQKTTNDDAQPSNPS